MDTITEPQTVPSCSEATLPLAKVPRILLVDDIPDVALSLAMLLRLHGYEVNVAHTGYQGLAAALAFRPDVAILDLGLPELNGWQLASRLRDLAGKECPILIALSGYGTEQDRRRSADAGFDFHFVKTIPIDAILAVLSEVTRPLPNDTGG